MKRFAVFVEVYTELLFVTKLAEELFSTKNILVEQGQVRGRTSKPITITIIRTAAAYQGQPLYMLVMDCGSDREVKARIVEQYNSLAAKGYQLIVGLRDFGPDYTGQSDATAQAKIKAYVPQTPIPVRFILAKEGTEAWFMAEHTHFPALNPALIPATIKGATGIDLENDDLSLLPRPHVDLKDIYDLAGLGLSKPWEATINALDYASICYGLPNKIPALKSLMAELEGLVT